MKQFVYSFLNALKDVRRDEYILKSRKFEKSRIESEIIRNVHSIEKGLSISNPRVGFGIKKIHEMFMLTDRYMKLTKETEVLFFVDDAVSEYLEYQEKIGFENDEIKRIRELQEHLQWRIGTHDDICGGTTIFKKSEIQFSHECVENLFHTRHSIRDFSGDKIPEELICKAIELAQCAPSACNRQAVRVYSILPDDYIRSIGNLEGIGGFAQDVDRFLLITGVKSAYRRGEKNQFVVSASMYAAYLTLSLHSLGIGVCTVQRSLFSDRIYRGVQEKFGISEDEQIVVMLGIGMMKAETKVPVSKRYSLKKIYRNLNI